MGSFKMISKSLIAATFALSLQAKSVDQCTEVDVVEIFDTEAYMGRWYEIYRAPNWFESGNCSTANYKLQEDGTIEVMNNEYDFGQESWGGAVGSARRANDPTDVDGHLEVRFSIFSPYGAYNIVDTDYETYSVVYNCGKNLSPFRRTCTENMWVLSRTPEMSEETLNYVNALIESQIPSFYPMENYLTKTLHGDSCSYDEQPEFPDKTFFDLFLE